jgi:predicted transcriptional regulator
MSRDLLTEASPEGEAEDISAESAVALTVNLVRAYVANHIVPPAQLASLLEQTHRTVLSLSNLKPEQPDAGFKPAVAGTQRIVCLECGKSFRSLKRHLAAQHGLSPDEYRMRWDLPPDYPITSPDYTAKRSSLARERGLGRRPKGETRPTTRDDEGEET